MFATFVTAVDDKDPSVHSLFARQVELPLPEKNYYLDKTLWSNSVGRTTKPSSKCTKEVNALLGDVVGAYYLKNKWSTDASKLANDLVDALAKSMEYGIEKSDWLDDWTRTNALAKLSKVARLVGGPESRQNISNVAVDGDAFLSSKWKLQLDANLANIYLMGTAVQRGKRRADVSPQTVNGYHTFAMYRITIPAGILQPPLFHPAADPAHNAGSKRVSARTKKYTNETGEKLFFLSFAQSWCAKYTDAGLQTQLLDVHPPGRFRVYGALQNNANFARVFNCCANTFMNPAKKCTLWE
ncbi:hypothetical protein AC1031_019481 [Aphanomyces cochlioides]|nr:hypothetical protein AC1031_019481 [Aphanomyces cochlioides]